jgi:AcrR family transcriptional regulator
MPQKTKTGSGEPPDVRRRRAKTEAILVAATDLFTSVGFSDTSLADVADKVDLTSKAVYYYYPSKHALLEAVLKRAFHYFDQDQLEAARQQWADLPQREALLESSLDSVQNLLENGDLLKLSFSESFHGSNITQRLHVGYIENWTAHFEQILNRYRQIDPAARREFAEHLASALFGTAVDAILRPRPVVARDARPSRAYFASIIDHLIDGLHWRPRPDSH